MNKYLMTFLIICLSIGITNYPSNAANKLAQTGMKFLSVSLDARASALGGAFTAMEGNSLVMFYNPAGMGFQDETFSIAGGQLKFIADINYYYGSASWQPGDGQFGVFGLTFISVDYGDFAGTIRAENEQGFLDTGTFNPLAFAFGLGYAKSLTSQFSFGLNVKFAKQDLLGGFVGFQSDQQGISINTDTDVFVFDIGILYRTGFKSLNFAMSIRNFSEEIKYIQESFQLPLTFRIGLAMDVLDLSNINKEVHSLLVTADASHPRDFSEQVSFGAEYMFMQIFALRAGYSFPNDEHGFSAGLGLHKDFSHFELGIDYSYTPFGVFDDVHRFTIQFSL